MKSLVFVGNCRNYEVVRMISLLSNRYDIRIIDPADKETLSPQDYFNGEWDYLIVCDDYSLFIQLPIKAKKAILWKTQGFRHPLFYGADMSNGFFLSNLTLDGIVKSLESVQGEGKVISTAKGWISFLEDIPLESVSLPIIGIQCNWTKTLKEDWIKLIPPWFKYEIVDGEGNSEGATFIFNGCDRFPQEKDIITTMEPECNRGHISQLWRTKPRNIQRNMIEWHLSLRWEQLENLTVDKTKILSAIVSGENRLEGHRKRLALIGYLDGKFPDKTFDLYGRRPHQLKSYRGSLTVKDPGLLPYKYHISVENCQENGYFTEKIVDGILAECLCFYWGCPDIGKYIDSRAYILLPLDNPEECLRIITEAINNNEWEKRIEYIRIEKWRIMNSWSIFPTIQGYLKHGDTSLNGPICVLDDGNIDNWKKTTMALVGKTYYRVEKAEDAKYPLVEVIH